MAKRRRLQVSGSPLSAAARIIPVRSGMTARPSAGDTTKMAERPRPQVSDLPLDAWTWEVDVVGWGVVGLRVRARRGVGKEIAMANNNEAAAQQMAGDLAQELGKGFKSVSRDALASAWREAKGNVAGERGNFSMSARDALRKALDRKRIKVYPHLGGKDTHAAYRLYHGGDLVAELVDAVTDPSETTDKMLEGILAREEVITVIRQVRSAP